MLDSDGYVKAHFALNGPPSSVSVEDLGIQQSLLVRDDDYHEKVTRVAAEIVNLNAHASRQVVETTNYPEAFVDHAVNVLESRGYLQASRSSLGLHIYNLSPKLKRDLMG